MAPLGTITEPTTSRDALARARARAALVPDLLVEARRVVATVTAGWHGRRRRGSGENFWQFRPYVDGAEFSRIDWRRSARDDSLYLRDRELEAAHTVLLWSDPSPSMLYRSAGVAVSKEGRALVLVLALAELLARSGERVGFLGLTAPVAARNAAERIATALTLRPAETSLPDTDGLKRHSEIILVSDFLDPVEVLTARIDAIARRGVRGHLVQIFDPAEEAFPFSGRTEFRDPESGARLTAGRAETLAAEYHTLWQARRAHLADHCRRIGWTFLPHATDRLASEALVALHARLSGGAVRTPERIS